MKSADPLWVLKCVYEFLGLVFPRCSVMKLKLRGLLKLGKLFEWFCLRNISEIEVNYDGFLGNCHVDEWKLFLAICICHNISPLYIESDFKIGD